MLFKFKNKYFGENKMIANGPSPGLQGNHPVFLIYKQPLLLFIGFNL